MKPMFAAATVSRNRWYVIGASLALISSVVLAAMLSHTDSSRALLAAAGKPIDGGNPTSSMTSAQFSQSSDRARKVILGDLRQVPFQELYQVIGSQRREQLQELAEELANLPPSADGTAKLRKFFNAWAHLDARVAFSAATSLKTTASQAAALDAVVEGADPSECGALAALISDMQGAHETKGGLLDRTITKWGQSDPSQAAHFIDSLQPSGAPWFVTASRSVAQSWAQSDPQSAVEWAQRLGQGPGTGLVVAAVVATWWKSDPSNAEAYTMTHLDTANGKQTAAAVASEMQSADPQRAQDWVSQLTSPEAKRAADMVIALQQSRTDPQGAAQWAASLPQDVRADALSAALGNWVRTDPQAAAQWVTSLTGAQRDDGLSAYSLNLSNSDPALALQWATTIESADIRDNAVQQIGTTWLNRTPDAARSWIVNSGLSDLEKQRLLSPPPHG